ncbi:ribonuclease H-like domain-containing protein [Tanacetum coccineum]
MLVACKIGVLGLILILITWYQSQNSDNSNSVIIPFKLLGTENYRIWSGAVKLALQDKNKYGFVDGTCLKESYTTSDVLSTQWDRCNVMVLTWIMNVVSQDVYIRLVYSENAVTVWKELNETYDKVGGSVVYNLLLKINYVKQGGSSVADYYHRLNSLWREFDALTKLPKCTCEVKCTCNASKELGLHQQLMKLMQFLMGMDDCDQPIRSSLLTRDPLLEVKDACNVVSRDLCLYVTTITMGWIIDSGANQHLTVSTAEMYNIVDISELKITVGYPNGTLSTISHGGNLKLTNNVILCDVLVVSVYCVSLLSVNKLIRDSKMFVGFDENKCYIQDLKREKVLGTRSESGGLNLFDMNNSNCIGKSNVVMSFHVSKLLWHNRLSHPADQVLYVLKNDLSIFDNTSVPVCEVCQRAKQTREPFPLSDHKSKGVFVFTKKRLTASDILPVRRDQTQDLFVFLF